MSIVQKINHCSIEDVNKSSIKYVKRYKKKILSDLGVENIIYLQSVPAGGVPGVDHSYRDVHLERPPIQLLRSLQGPT